MKKQYLIVGLVVVVLGVGIWWSTSQNSAPVSENIVPENTNPQAAVENDLPPKTGEKVQTVFSTNEGYSPNNLTIKVGDTVAFKNENTRPVWTASAMHPSHKVYPGSDIAKCGTADEGKIFDACKGVANGESWSFKFDVAGTWKYHDHLNPSNYGSVVVE